MPVMKDKDDIFKTSDAQFDRELDQFSSDLDLEESASNEKAEKKAEKVEKEAKKMEEYSESLDANVADSAVENVHDLHQAQAQLQAQVEVLSQASGSNPPLQRSAFQPNRVSQSLFSQSGSNPAPIVSSPEFSKFLDGESQSFTGNIPESWVKENKGKLEAAGLTVKRDGDKVTITNNNYNENFRYGVIKGKDFNSFLTGEKPSYSSSGREESRWIAKNKDELEKRGIDVQVKGDSYTLTNRNFQTNELDAKAFDGSHLRGKEFEAFLKGDQVALEGSDKQVAQWAKEHEEDLLKKGVYSYTDDSGKYVFQNMGFLPANIPASSRRIMSKVLDEAKTEAALSGKFFQKAKEAVARGDDAEARRYTAAGLKHLRSANQLFAPISSLLKSARDIYSKSDKKLSEDKEEKRDGLLQKAYDHLAKSITETGERRADSIMRASLTYQTIDTEIYDEKEESQRKESEDDAPFSEKLGKTIKSLFLRGEDKEDIAHSIELLQSDVVLLPIDEKTSTELVTDIGRAAEYVRNGEMEKAKSVLTGVKGKIPEIVETEEIVSKLKKMGASSQVTEALGKQVSQERRELMMRAARAITENSDMLTPQMVKALSMFIVELTDEKTEPKKAKEVLDQFEAGLSEALRTEARKSFGFKIKSYQSMLGNLPYPLRVRVEAGITKVREIEQRLKEDPSTVTDEEIIYAKKLTRGMDFVISLQPGLGAAKASSRKNLTRMHAAALHALEFGDEKRFNLIMRAVSEYTHTDNSKILDKVTDLEVLIIGGHHSSEVEKAEVELLGVLAGSLKKDLTTLVRGDGDAAAWLASSGIDLDNPSSEDIERARMAVNILKGMKSHPDRRASYMRALHSQDMKIAEMHFTLANIGSEESQKISEKLTPETMPDAQLFVQLHQKTREYEAARKRYPDAKALDLLITELNAARDFKITDDEIDTQAKLIEERMKKDPDFRQQVGKITKQEMRQLAEAMVLRRKQQRVSNLIQIGDSMTRAMKETPSAIFRKDLAEIYTFAIQTNNPTYLAAAKTYSALGSNDVTLSSERKVVLETCRDLAEGKITEQTARNILAVQEQRAVYEAEFKGSTVLRNVRTYFDYALIAARQGKNPQTVLELAVLYSQAATVPKAKLTEEEATKRKEALEFVKSQLGDYRKDRGIIAGKRVSEGYSTETPAVLSDNPPEIADKIAKHARAVDDIDFEVRARGLSEPSKDKYDKESARLEKKSSYFKSKERHEEADYFKFQQSMSDPEFVKKTVQDAREIRKMGLEARAKAEELVAEASNADGATKQTVQKRNKELVAALPPEEKKHYESLMVRDPKKAYQEMLLLHARMSQQRSQSLLVSANNILQGLDTFDSSITDINTINRHSGRMELYTGLKIQVGIAKGYATDMLGEKMEGKPDQQMESQAMQLLGSGSSMVAQQKQIQQIRNSGLARAKTELHERNLDQAKQLIEGLIATLPEADQEKYRSRLKSAGDDVEKLQGVISSLGVQTGIRVKDDKGEFLYDAKAREDGYQNVRRNFWGENFGAANRMLSTEGFMIQSGALRQNNYITHHNLSKAMWAGIGGRVESTYIMGTPGLVKPEERHLRNRAAVAEMIAHLPADQREKYQKRLDGISLDAKPGSVDFAELASMEVELSKKEVSTAPGAPKRNLGMLVAKGETIYYDADWFDGRIAKSQELAQTDLSQAGEDLGTIQSDMQKQATAQRHENSALRIRSMAHNVLLQRNREDGIYEKPTGKETKRPRIELQDRNMLLEEGVDALKGSEARGSEELYEAAHVHEKARDALASGGEALQIEIGSVIGILMNHSESIMHETIEIPENLKKQKLADGRTFEEAFGGKTYAQIQESMIDDSSGNLARGNSTAQGLYLIMSANTPRMEAAFARMRSPSSLGFSESHVLQMEATVHEGVAMNRFANKQVAWQYSRMMLGKAQDSFKLADMSGSSRRRERNQRSIEEEKRLGWAPYEYTDIAHRNHASMAMEAAIAAVDKNNDHRFIKLLTEPEYVTAKIYQKTIPDRDWHEYKGGKWVTVYDATAGGFHNYRHNRSINFSVELLKINNLMARELKSYTEAADSDDLNYGQVYRNIATDQTYIELATLGVKTEYSRDGYTILVAEPFTPTKEESEMIQKTYQQIMYLRGSLQATLFGHDTSWGEDAQEKFIKRIGERINHARNGCSQLVSPENTWGTNIPSNYADIANNTFAQSGQIEVKDGKIIDNDSVTKTAIEDMADMAAWNRVAWAAGEFVVATAGVLLAPVTGGGSLVLTVGVGAKGVYSGVQMKEDQGEWSGMAAFQVGAGIATMVLPFAGEIGSGLSTSARLTSELASTGVQLSRAQRLGQFLFASRTLTSPGMTLGQRTMINLLKGGSTASRFQTAVHLAGLGLNVPSIAMYGYTFPQIYKQYKEGGKPWFEIAFEVSQLALGVAGAYRGARRSARYDMGLYTPRWVQALDLTMGIPMDNKYFHTAAKDFAKLPQELRDSYSTFKAKQRVEFTPETEIKVMMEYKKACQNKNIPFDEFAMSPEARSMIYEGAYDGVVHGASSMDALSPEMQKYVDGRVHNEDIHLKVKRGDLKINDLTKEQKAYVKARNEGKGIAEAMVIYMDAAPLPKPAKPVPSAKPEKGEVIQAKEPIQYAIDLQLNDPANLSKFAREVVLNEGNARGILEAMPEPVQKAVKKLAGDEYFIHAAQSDGNFKLYTERFAKKKIAEIAAEIDGHFPPGTEGAARAVPLEATTGQPVDAVGTPVEVTDAPVMGTEGPVAMAGKKKDSKPPPVPEVGKTAGGPVRRTSQVEESKDFIAGLGTSSELQTSIINESFSMLGVDLPEAELASLAAALGKTANAKPLPLKKGGMVRTESNMQLREMSGYPGVYELTIHTSKGTVSVMVKARNFNDSMAGMKAYDVLGIPRPKTVKINDNLVVQQKLTVDFGNGPEFISPEHALARGKNGEAPLLEGSERAPALKDFGEQGAIDYALGIPDSHMNNFAFYEENGVIRAVRIDYENAGIGWGEGVANPARDHEKFWGESILAHYEQGDLASVVQGIESGIAKIGNLTEPQIKEIIGYLKAHEGETFARGEKLTSERIDAVAKRLRTIRDNPEMAKYDMMEYSFDIWRRAYSNPDQENHTKLNAEAEQVFKDKVLASSPEVVAKSKRYFENLRDNSGNPKTVEFAEHVLSLYPDAGPSGSGPKGGGPPPGGDKVVQIKSSEEFARNALTENGAVDADKVANFARDYVLDAGNTRQQFESLPKDVQTAIRKLTDNNAFRIAASDDKRFAKHIKRFGARQLREVTTEISKTLSGREADAKAVPLEATTGQPIDIRGKQVETTGIDESQTVAMAGGRKKGPGTHSETPEISVPPTTVHTEQRGARAPRPVEPVAKPGEVQRINIKDGENVIHVDVPSHLQGEKFQIAFDKGVHDAKVNHEMQRLRSMHSANAEPANAVDRYALDFLKSKGTPTDADFQAAAEMSVIAKSEFISSSIDHKISKPGDIAGYDGMMQKFIFEHPEAFVSRGEPFVVGEQTVRIGSALQFEGDTAVPVFITGKDGKTHMAIAYRSKSQATWRRFAGNIMGRYFKGNVDDLNFGGTQKTKQFEIEAAEHLQNMHSAIQKRLDELVYSDAKQFNMTGNDGNLLQLSELSPSIGLVHDMEKTYQISMRKENPPINLHDDPPGKIVDFWESGSYSEAYGKHFNLLVESESGKYTYCVGVTEDGLFIKYVQDNRSGEINSAGAPRNGAIPENIDLLRPALEYAPTDKYDRKYLEPVRGEAVESFGYGRGTRVRFIVDQHQTPDSALYNLHTMVHEAYPLLRAGDLNGARQKIAEHNGAEVVKQKAPTPIDPETILFIDNERMAVLEIAFQEHLNGKLDASRMNELGISEREVAAFERIKEINPKKQYGELRLLAYTGTRDSLQAKVNTGTKESAAATELLAKNIGLEVDALVSAAGQPVDNPFSGIYSMQRYRMNEILKSKGIEPSKASAKQLQDAALQSISEVNMAISIYRLTETTTPEQLASQAQKVKSGEAAPAQNPELGTDFTISIPERRGRSLPPGTSDVIDQVAIFKSRNKRPPSREELFAIALGVAMKPIGKPGGGGKQGGGPGGGTFEAAVETFRKSNAVHTDKVQVSSQKPVQQVPRMEMVGTEKPSQKRVQGLVAESTGHVDNLSPLHSDAEIIRKNPNADPVKMAEQILQKKVNDVAKDIQEVAELWMSGVPANMAEAQKRIAGWANDPNGGAKYEAVVYMTAEGSEFLLSPSRGSIAKKMASEIIDVEGGIRADIPESRAKEIYEIAVKHVNGDYSAFEQSQFTPAEARLFARAYNIEKNYPVELAKVTGVMGKTTHTPEEKVIFDRVNEVMQARGMDQQDAIKYVADERVRPHAVDLEQSRYIVYGGRERSTQGFPNDFYTRDKAPANKRHGLNEEANPLKGIPRARLLGRIDRTPGVPVEDTTGASAAVYEVEILVDGAPVKAAGKVFLDPGGGSFEDNFAYARQELQNLEILSKIKVTLPDGRVVPLGPKAYGFVDVGGNPTIAMERIYGKAIGEMTPDQIRQFVTPETYAQLKAMWEGLTAAGYAIGDFQFAVLTQAQEVNGVMRQPGDVVFWDAGALRKGSTTDTGDYQVQSAKLTAELTLASDAFTVKQRDDGKTRMLVSDNDFNQLVGYIRGVYKAANRTPSNDDMQLLRDFFKLGPDRYKWVDYIIQNLPPADATRFRTALKTMEQQTGIQFIQ